MGGYGTFFHEQLHIFRNVCDIQRLECPVSGVVLVLQVVHLASSLEPCNGSEILCVVFDAFCDVLFDQNLVCEQTGQKPNRSDGVVTLVLESLPF